jgi:hypothetical protein
MKLLRGARHSKKLDSKFLMDMRGELYDVHLGVI